MGWDWDAVKKGNIIRFWWYDGTMEPMISVNIKFNFNIRSKKLYNVRIYIINDMSQKAFDNSIEEDYDNFHNYWKKRFSVERKGYVDAIKYLNGTPPPEVNAFINDCEWCNRSFTFGKTYKTSKGTEYKYLTWGFPIRFIRTVKNRKK